MFKYSYGTISREISVAERRKPYAYPTIFTFWPARTPTDHVFCKIEKYLQLCSYEKGMSDEQWVQKFLNMNDVFQHFARNPVFSREHFAPIISLGDRSILPGRDVADRDAPRSVLTKIAKVFVKIPPRRGSVKWAWDLLSSIKVEQICHFEPEIIPAVEGDDDSVLGELIFDDHHEAMNPFIRDTILSRVSAPTGDTRYHRRARDERRGILV
jgi:hypothetical protein